MQKFYIAVLGNMGSGKTTVAKLLAEGLNAKLVLENFANNPFLANFYNDMKRWAFSSQAFFLTEKVKQTRKISKSINKKNLIQDTPLFQDVNIWAKAQLLSKNMDTAEWRLYWRLSKLFQDGLRQPDIYVYFQTSIPILQDRINKRKREFEKEVPVWYLKTISKLLEESIEKKLHHVLTINTDKKNFVNNDEDKAWLINTVKEKIIL